MSCQKTPYCSWLIVRPLTGPSKSHRHAEIGKPSALGWSWPCRHGRLRRLALGGGPPSDHRALIQSVDPGGRQGIYVLTFPVRNASRGWCERYTKPSRWSALHLLPRGLQLLTAQRKTPGTPSSTREVSNRHPQVDAQEPNLSHAHTRIHTLGRLGVGPPSPSSSILNMYPIRYKLAILPKWAQKYRNEASHQRRFDFSAAAALALRPLPLPFPFLPAAAVLVAAAVPAASVEFAPAAAPVSVELSPPVATPVSVELSVPVAAAPPVTTPESLVKSGVPRPVTCHGAHQYSVPIIACVATYRIPASGSGEALGTAPGVAARRNVVKRGDTLGVQEGIQEAERALASIEQLVVQERNNRGEGGARRARAVDTLELASRLDNELDTLGRDVGVPAAGGVEETRVGVAEGLQVAVDGVGLVVGARKDVRETARREVGGGLGADALRAANSGDASNDGQRDMQGNLLRNNLQGASGGEGGNERSAIAGVISLRAGDTTIARCEQDGSSTGTKLSVRVTERLRELRSLLGERRLVKAETGRQHERGVLLVGERGDDVKEAVERAVLRLRANSDERDRDVRRHADGVLNVEALQTASENSAHTQRAARG